MAAAITSAMEVSNMGIYSKGRKRREGMGHLVGRLVDYSVGFVGDEVLSENVEILGEADLVGLVAWNLDLCRGSEDEDDVDNGLGWMLIDVTG